VQGVNTHTFLAKLCGLLKGNTGKPLPDLLFPALLEDRLGHGVRYSMMVSCIPYNHTGCSA
jgi:hypothetical protein